MTKNHIAEIEKRLWDVADELRANSAINEAIKAIERENEDLHNIVGNFDFVMVSPMKCVA